jgi:hypothetical protein
MGFCILLTLYIYGYYILDIDRHIEHNRRRYNIIIDWQIGKCCMVLHEFWMR